MYIDIPMTPAIKLLTGLLVFTLFVLAGVAALTLVLYLGDIPLEETDNLIGILEEGSYTNTIRLALGANHLVTFVAGSYVLSRLFSNKSYCQYTPLNGQVSMSIFMKVVLLLLLCYPMAGLLGYFSSQLVLPAWMQNFDHANESTLSELIKMDDWQEMLLNLLVIAVLPGIGEEMLFRGIIQNELQQTMRSKALALILASFIFAAFHLDFTGLLPKFIIGLVLGITYLLTRNLLYSILLHILNNGSQVLLAYFYITPAEEAPIQPPDFIQIIGILATLPLIYFYITYLTASNNHGTGIENQA
ncbi:MAG: CPBP family intramembrane metalloprotease [Saprospiraceae bacterium]|nr:CPBP family intramembrane metalloprotease [Saprospiraceae bacterium]